MGTGSDGCRVDGRDGTAAGRPVGRDALTVEEPVSARPAVLGIMHAHRDREARDRSATTTTRRGRGVRSARDPTGGAHRTGGGGFCATGRESTQGPSSPPPPACRSPRGGRAGVGGRRPRGGTGRRRAGAGSGGVGPSRRRGAVGAVAGGDRDGAGAGPLGASGRFSGACTASFGRGSGGPAATSRSRYAIRSAGRSAGARGPADRLRFGEYEMTVDPLDALCRGAAAPSWDGARGAVAGASSAARTADSATRGARNGVYMGSEAGATLRTRLANRMAGDWTEGDWSTVAPTPRRPRIPGTTTRRSCSRTRPAVVDVQLHFAPGVDAGTPLRCPVRMRATSVAALRAGVWGGAPSPKRITCWTTLVRGPQAPADRGTRLREPTRTREAPRVNDTAIRESPQN